jgi:tRNA-dihydrouridine synthase 1
MAQAMTIEAFREVVNHIRDKYRPFHDGEAVWDGEPSEDYVPDYNLRIPPWICQPYYRTPPDEYKQMIEEKTKALEHRPKPKYFDGEGNEISRKRMKKLKRLEKRVKIRIERHQELCSMKKCDNTRGLKCEFSLCRICCRRKCFDDNLHCPGHLKNKRERAEQFDEEEEAEASVEKMKTNDDGEHVVDVE